LALHDDGAVAELHQILAGIAARVGLLDAVRERALGADGDATGGGRRRTGQHAGRDHEDVIGPQGIAFGVALVQKDPGRQRPAAEQLPLLGVGLDAHRLIRHVDPDESIFT